MTVDQAIQQGLEHHHAGRLQQAEQVYREILQQVPNQPEALHLLGLIAQQVGQLQPAAELIERAISAQPSVALFHSNLGEIFRQLGQLDRAEASLRMAIKLDRTLSNAHAHLGLLLQDKGSLNEAVTSLQRAIELAPDLAVAHNNLGAAMEKQSRLPEAEAAYRRAVELDPRHPGFLNNLGSVLRHSGNVQAAMKFWSQAAELAPEYPDPNWNLALTHLALGDFERGWPLYEWRFKYGLGQQFLREYPAPRWDGFDLHGKTILLYAEQGFGDVIMFARFIPEIAAMGARVIVHVQPPLLELIRSVDGVEQAISLEDPAPPVDAYQALLSLPMILRTTPQTLPNKVPYLRVDPIRRKKWSAQFSATKKLKVGLVWSGRPTHPNNANRSIPLKLFEPLFDLPEIEFFSLQKDERVTQIPDLGRDLHDFADTACAIANVDLLISVDTAAAHVAGAIASPVWTLIPFSPDFRWQLEGEESIWYPTMRLFRQSRPNDWPAVIDRVKDELKKRIKTADERR